MFIHISQAANCVKVTVHDKYVILNCKWGRVHTVKCFFQSKWLASMQQISWILNRCWANISTQDKHSFLSLCIILVFRSTDLHITATLATLSHHVWAFICEAWGLSEATSVTSVLLVDWVTESRPFSAFMHLYSTVWKNVPCHPPLPKTAELFMCN